MPQKPPARASMAEKVGDAAFYFGFIAGICAGLLLYAEAKDIKRSLFDQLLGDSGITFSLIAAFVVPLGIGWLLRYIISGKRWS
jgi:hypothetical protein